MHGIVCIHVGIPRYTPQENWKALRPCLSSPGQGLVCPGHSWLPPGYASDDTRKLPHNKVRITAPNFRKALITAFFLDCIICFIYLCRKDSVDRNLIQHGRPLGLKTVQN